MTQGRASSDDINQVLSLLEFIFPRFSTVTGFMISFGLRFILPLVLLICFEKNGVFRDSMNVWISLWLYWGVGLLFLIYEKDQKIKQVKADVEGIIKMVQPGYLKRGLRWRLPKESEGWIELVKEYNENEQLNALIVKVEQPDEGQEGTEGDSQYQTFQDVKE